MYSKISSLTVTACFFSIILTGQIELPNHNEPLEVFNHFIEQEYQISSAPYEEDLLIAQRNDIFIDDVLIKLDSIEFHYDLNDRLSSTLTLRKNGDSWDDYQSETFTYDSSGNLINSLSQLFVDGVFTNVSQTLREFDTNNNPTSSIRYTWLDNNWVPEQRLDYAYDDLNLLTTYIRYRYDIDWIPVFRYTYTYNSDNLETAELTESWGGTEWQDSRRQETFYNVLNNITEIDRREWNGTDWTPFLRYVNEYDENNLFIKQTLFRAPEGEYVNWLLYCVNYNADGLVDDQTFFEWIDDEWLNEYHDIFEYDDRENRTYRLRENWDIDSSTWVNGRQNFYYYEFVSPTVDEKLENTKVELAPNPNNGIFNIISKSKEGPVQFSVYSNTGQLVFISDSYKFNEESNLSFLQSGSYFLKISSEEKTVVKKLIIQD